MGVGGQRHAPAALPLGNNRYPLYRMLGGSQGRSGRVRKISPPSGFDPRTVQPVASRYTDWAIPGRQPPQTFLNKKTIHFFSFLWLYDSDLNTFLKYMTHHCSEFNSNVVTFLKTSTSLCFSEFDANMTTFTEKKTPATTPNLWQKPQRLAKNELISVIWGYYTLVNENDCDIKC
jgi:hypothetical protein